ncbi:hypothetical protein Cob_v012820 [Colletotrichum orbiculare MAFF 240422]|uniref:Uncharacterized protein n=1 Tax=Colletotrichum orbiculare (strain 104-T / ATCC 96160 / CBS 514.97 / LARS 414 / MAFF 240422) TaxID=1213857 RepID=A0A484F9L0_COLOR|nr:hypothetical protein Cob_v012820 [Colletotrichum orbiculare MAFF 240422]
MPTSELSQIVFSNIGPLTTVFTAPSACATPTAPVRLGYKADDSGDETWGSFRWSNNCDDIPLGDCHASGSLLDAQFSDYLTKGGITGMGNLGYFSPASQCPDGHTTAGVASKGADGKDAFLIMNPVANVFMEALEEGERAVVCCQENYTANHGFGCFSEVPVSSYGNISTACGVVPARSQDSFTWVNATFTYNDTVYTTTVFTVTATSFPPLTITTTDIDFPPSEESLAAYVEGGMYLLVNRPAEATTNGTSGAAPPSETAGSSASGRRMMTSGGGVGVLATACTFAAFVGMMVAS